MPAAIKAILDSLEGVDEGLAQFYVEKDGKFVLTLDGVNDHPSVKALNTALAAVKADRVKAAAKVKELETKLATYPEDFDADDYAKLQDLRASLEAESGDDSADKSKDKSKRTDLATLQAQKIANLTKEFDKKLTGKDAIIAKRDAVIQNLLIDNGLTQEFIKGGVAPEFMEAAKALVRSRAGVDMEDEENPRAVIKTDAGDIALDKYVPDWLGSDSGRVFVTKAKGGDADGSGKRQDSSSKEANPWKADPVNLTLAAKIIREDRAKAERLAKAAGKDLHGRKIEAV